MGNLPLLPVVLFTGFLNSFNPCAISLLLIFISLMFTLGKERKEIIAFGTAYIASIYVTYLIIGVTSMQILTVAGASAIPYPNLIARIGAVLVIVFGLLNIKEYFFPQAPFSIKIPLKVRGYVSRFAFQATIASAIIVGVLIGLYQFPCSGAIYLAIISLISTKTSFAVGLLYLLLYNLMFVLPLIVIFVLATNKITTEKFINLQEQHGRKLHLFLAVVMILLGVGILFFTR